MGPTCSIKTLESESIKSCTCFVVFFYKITWDMNCVVYICDGCVWISDLESLIMNWWSFDGYCLNGCRSVGRANSEGRPIWLNGTSIYQHTCSLEHAQFLKAARIEVPKKKHLLIDLLDWNISICTLVYLSSNSKWLLVGSWLFCIQHLSCWVSLGCMLGDSHVEVWTKSILDRFIKGQTEIAVSRGAKMSLAPNEPK